MPDQELLIKLQAENARLIALLESRGIEWRPPSASLAMASEPSKLSTADKVALFRRLFRGRMDVYPIRWESKTTGKSGYAPACANEWRAGVCEKPRIKCGDCGNRLLIPLSDAVIYGHLAGEHTVGVYPCWRMTAATLSPSISTKRTGGKMPEHSWGRARRLACLRHSRFLAPGVALTPGFFFPAGFRRVTRGAWARPSSATHAHARGSSS